MDAPLLFHLRRPTTVRTVANTVKTRGLAGLVDETEARCRADRATYQEVICRSALNRVKGMPFDVMQELSRRATCTVYLSVPCVDEDVWEKLEPGTAHPLKRLRALRQLREAGIDAGVLMNPIVPGISSHPAQIERTVRAAVDHGATFIGANVLFLEGGTRAHFMGFLAREYPALAGGYEEMYRRKYAPDAYRKKISALVDRLQKQHGAGRRPRGAAPKERPPEQPRFRW